MKMYNYHLPDWDMGTFGENLTNMRKSRQLTQQQLAEHLDINPRLISRWETGYGKPSFDHLTKLADALEVTIDELIRGQNPKSRKRSPEIRNIRLRELCKRADKLNKSDQEALCHIMETMIQREAIKRTLK